MSLSYALYRALDSEGYTKIIGYYLGYSERFI